MYRNSLGAAAVALVIAIQSTFASASPLVVAQPITPNENEKSALGLPQVAAGDEVLAWSAMGPLTRIAVSTYLDTAEFVSAQNGASIRFSPANRTQLYQEMATSYPNAPEHIQAYIILFPDAWPAIRSLWPNLPSAAKQEITARMGIVGDALAPVFFRKEAVPPQAGDRTEAELSIPSDGCRYITASVTSMKWCP